METTISLSNLGGVVSLRGSVVDIRFDQHLPSIYSVLRAGDQGRIVIEVQAQRDGHHVRGIALTPTQGRGGTGKARKKKCTSALRMGKGEEWREASESNTQGRFIM